LTLKLLLEKHAVMLEPAEPGWGETEEI